jgi:hypothetical protein
MDFMMICLGISLVSITLVYLICAVALVATAFFED